MITLSQKKITPLKSTHLTNLKNPIDFFVIMVYNTNIKFREIIMKDKNEDSFLDLGDVKQELKGVSDPNAGNIVIKAELKKEQIIQDHYMRKAKAKKYKRPSSMSY